MLSTVDGHLISNSTPRVKTLDHGSSLFLGWALLLLVKFIALDISVPSDESSVCRENVWNLIVENDHSSAFGLPSNALTCSIILVESKLCMTRCSLALPVNKSKNIRESREAYVLRRSRNSGLKKM
jgi:hypothetical protein